MWKKRSCLLSLGGWCGLFGHTDTHTRTLLSSLSQISTHFHPSTPHCAPPLGHIMSWPCDKEPGSSGGGGGGVGADCQTGRAGFSWSLPLSALSVSFSVLIAAADLSFPRGLCERREMWCCYSGASYGGVCLRWPCCISLRTHTPPPPSILPEQRDSRRQARCNRSLRYAGQTLPPLPRASSAPETEWRGHRDQLYIRGSSSARQITTH